DLCQIERQVGVDSQQPIAQAAELVDPWADHVAFCPEDAVTVRRPHEFDTEHARPRVPSGRRSSASTVPKNTERYGAEKQTLPDAAGLSGVDHPRTVVGESRKRKDRYDIS